MVASLTDLVPHKRVRNQTRQGKSHTLDSRPEGCSSMCRTDAGRWVWASSVTDAGAEVPAREGDCATVMVRYSAVLVATVRSRAHT